MPTQNLYVPDDAARLWAAASELAEKRGMSLSKMVTRLLRNELLASHAGAETEDELLAQIADLVSQVQTLRERRSEAVPV